MKATNCLVLVREDGTAKNVLTLASCDRRAIERSGRICRLTWPYFGAEAKEHIP